MVGWGEEGISLDFILVRGDTLRGGCPPVDRLCVIERELRCCREQWWLRAVLENLGGSCHSPGGRQEAAARQDAGHRVRITMVAVRRVRITVADGPRVPVAVVGACRVRVRWVQETGHCGRCAQGAGQGGGRAQGAGPGEGSGRVQAGVHTEPLKGC